MAKQTAQLNYLRIAPRKVRMVCDLLRGLSVNEAEGQLLLERRRAAKPLLKLLRSAVANVKMNAKLDPQKLYIEGIRVDQGPMFKRLLPRARGTATPIQKKMAHVTLTLAEREGTTPRFTIVVPKKTKLQKEEKRKTKKEEKRDEETKKISEKPRRGLRRFFTRKSNPGQ